MGDISRKWDLEQPPDAVRHFLCRECGKETSHRIVASYTERGSEDCGDGNSVEWVQENQTIQCLGCNDVSFRVASRNSEEYDFGPAGTMYYPESVRFYPARSVGLKPLETDFLPRQVARIYRETILAIENEQNVLAGVGIRAIIETICKEQEAKGGNLHDKINALREMSIVTNEGAEALHRLRVLGNDAAHEVKKTPQPQLRVAMKVVEHMLDGTYILPEHVAQSFKDS